MPIDWMANWDDSVGLWLRESPGHTAPVSGLSAVHPGPDASSRLLLAAQLGEIGSLKALGVLKALRRMQSLDGGDLHGCVKWYHEEPEPCDTNAAFFTSLGLIPLRARYLGCLAADERELLDSILRDFGVWFTHEVDGRAFYYPNKYLGDLVCSWLIGEMFGGVPAGLPKAMRLAAEYWTVNGWGWGEHMSDCYSRVCLDELSLLLLLASRLPDDIRDAYQRLYLSLLEIDDAFGDGPRVPAIRTYNFLKAPERKSYRCLIGPHSKSLSSGDVRNMPVLGPLFHELGWERLAPPLKPPQQTARRSLTVGCHGGATAEAWIASDIRVGGMTRFPVMPSAEHQAWGLSWQSMPVLFWTPAGEWGYWQWETDEGGRIRSHPAVDVRKAYLGNSLTTAMRQPVVGRTFSLMRGGNLLILRVMPLIAAAWSRLTDRLRLIEPKMALEARPPVDGWTQLLMRVPGRTVAAQCLSLTAKAVTTGPELVRLSEPASLLDWELNLTGPSLDGAVAMATLWGLSVDGEVVEPPSLSPDRGEAPLPRGDGQAAWRLEWRWPSVEWRVRVDPLDSEKPITLN